MTGLQIFAFVALPIAVAIVGWTAAFIVAPVGRATKSEGRSRSEPQQTHA